MADEPKRRRTDRLKETAVEASEIGQEAGATARARRAQVRRPVDRERAQQVRLEDDLSTAEGQQALAEKERRAAEALRHTASVVRDTTDDIRQTHEEVRRRSQAVDELARTARAMRERAASLRDGVRNTQLVDPDAGDVSAR